VSGSARRITIEFLGKDKSAGRTADQVGDRMGKVGDKLKKFGAVAAGGLALAGIAVGKLGVDAVKSASDMNETLSKSQVIFGKQSKAMEGWAGTAWKSAGLSKQAALEAAAGFGDMFSQIGFAGDQAAKMSKSTVQMAADLGSFNNLPTGDVAERLSAAFRGEYDSLQALIPNINAARVEQEAMAKTGKKNASELTAQEKAAAVLAIVHKDGARAQGDFARTSNGLANQQKILGAQFENLKVKIGQKLLPVAVKLAMWATGTMMPALSRLSSFLQQKVGPAIERIRAIFSRSSGGMSSDVRRNLDAIRSTFQSVVSIIQSLWARFGGALTAHAIATFKALRTVIGGALQVIAGVFKVFSALLKGDWAGVWSGIKQILRGAWAIIRGIVAAGWATIKAAFRIGGAAIKGIFGGIWNGVKALARAGATGVVNLIKGIPGRLRALGGVFKAAGRGLIHQFVEGMKNAAGIISGIAGNVWKAVKSLLNGAINKINAALDFKISIPGPDVHVNAPNIPRLAKGAIVRRRPGGIIANIGEGRYDEGVFPLDKNGMPRGMAAAAGDAGVVEVHTHVYLDSKEIHTGLRRYRRQLGRPLGLEG